MIRRGFFSIALTILVVAGQFGLVQAGNSAEDTKTKTPIKHLVVLMQENHTFDNYFGTYPGADGIPSGTKMLVDPKNPNAGYVEPWYVGGSTISDLSHSSTTF